MNSDLKYFGGLALLVLAVVGVSQISFGTNYPQIPSQYERQSEAIPTPNASVQATEAKPVEAKNIDIKKGTALFLTEEVTAESSNKVIDGIRDANHKKPGQPIYLLLDSPGGSVLDGARVISAIQASKAPVYTVCLQICASMAAMILEYGHERYAVDRSIVMFHPASVGTMYQGELDKLVSRFSFLKRFVDKMDYYTASRSGQSYESFKAKSSRELWIDAEDALRDHYIDKIVRVDLSSGYKVDFGNNKMREHIKLSW
jgi:ATP-dependent Clp protease protease subunit